MQCTKTLPASMDTPAAAYVIGISGDVLLLESYDTVIPSSAGSRSSQSAVIPSLLNCSIRCFAMLSKFCVAKASIVGPAPERHIPNSPGCDLGVTDCRISVRPGINPFRYG